MHTDERNTILAFLSSPGDVVNERAAVAATIRHLNEDILASLDLHIDLVSSDTVLPGSGRPQRVISRQLPKYDLFIGIMWARFGTPTERAGSGTEEELNEALERAKATDGAPHILLYFCNRPVPFPKSFEEVRQLEQALAFREKCKANLLCSSFDDIGAFERLLRRHLFQFAVTRSQSFAPFAELRLIPAQSSINEALRRLEAKFRQLVWAAYAPVDFDPGVGRYPDERSIETDLQVLSRGPIGGIVTFGSEHILAKVPAIAKAVGIRGVIMGVYDPCNDAELDAALAAKESVDGYCVGHLGLREGRYDQTQLERAIHRIRSGSGKPVSTTESLEDLVAFEGLSDCVDWLFPDVHHYWHEGTNPEAALSDFARTRDTVRLLREYLGVHRPLLMKMLSYPSGGGHGLTPENQHEFFTRTLRALRDDVSGPGRLYASFFSAFDSAWKTPDRGWSTAELSTGLYDLERSPKAAVQAFTSFRRWSL